MPVWMSWKASRDGNSRVTARAEPLVGVMNGD